jgi:hypothetical protein
MPQLENSIRVIIERLISNKECPKFQFERAAETLLSPLIEEWLPEKVGYGIEYVTNEFPVKKRNNNQSTNSDFLYITENRGCLLVELKTDRSSYNDKQYATYLNATDYGWKKLYSDITKIQGGSTKKSKYTHLLKKISQFNIDEDVPVEVVFITPHEQRPRNLPTSFCWFSLKDMFENFESKKHHELWLHVKSLGTVI